MGNCIRKKQQDIIHLPIVQHCACNNQSLFDEIVNLICLPNVIKAVLPLNKDKRILLASITFPAQHQKYNNGCYPTADDKFTRLMGIEHHRIENELSFRFNNAIKKHNMCGKITILGSNGWGYDRIIVFNPIKITP